MDGAMLASIPEDGLNLMHLDYLLAFDGVIAHRLAAGQRRSR